MFVHNERSRSIRSVSWGISLTYKGLRRLSLNMLRCLVAPRDGRGCLRSQPHGLQKLHRIRQFRCIRHSRGCRKRGFGSCAPTNTATAEVMKKVFFILTGRPTS
jgi:hypothetical protein